MHARAKNIEYFLGSNAGGGGGWYPRYIGSMPGSNPCPYLYNRVKHRGTNSIFRRNIGGTNSIFRGNIGVKTLHKLIQSVNILRRT